MSRHKPRRHGLTTRDLAFLIREEVDSFYSYLIYDLPDEIVVPLAVAFGRRLIAELLDEAFGPARDTPPREEG